MGCVLSVCTSRNTTSTSLVPQISAFSFDFMSLGTSFLTSPSRAPQHRFNGRLTLTRPICCSRCNWRHRRTGIVPLFQCTTVGQVEPAHLKTYKNKNGSLPESSIPFEEGGDSNRIEGVCWKEGPKARVPAQSKSHDDKWGPAKSRRPKDSRRKLRRR